MVCCCLIILSNKSSLLETSGTRASAQWLSLLIRECRVFISNLEMLILASKFSKFIQNKNSVASADGYIGIGKLPCVRMDKDADGNSVVLVNAHCNG